MDIEVFVKKIIDIYPTLLDFIESTDDSKDEYQSLIEILEKHEISQNKEAVRLLFQLISKIVDNYHRTTDFFTKIEQLIKYLIKDPSSPISNYILDYSNYNKRVLFLLLDKNLITPDQSFINYYLQKIRIILTLPKQKLEENESYYYLYPMIKKSIDEKTQKQIEKKILENFEEENISNFEEKCQKGENDSYICSLIRSDSVEEFITYVNRTNLSLSSKIKPSVFETNSFLINKEPTLIEYASFFGSIQIIRYLKYNKVPLTFSLWLYAVHSNNAELIHFLEENEVKPIKNEKNETKDSYDVVLVESIKCHHNNISNYIKDNLLEQTTNNNFNDIYGLEISNSLNFSFYPNDIKSLICKPRTVKGFSLSQVCSSMTNLIIPSSITSIGDNSFANCSTLKEITIHSSITLIGANAFDGCSSLMNIKIPSSVKIIENGAFKDCSSIKEFVIPSSIKSIGMNTFLGCTSLTNIQIPSSITSIGNGAFSGCSSLTNIQIPTSVISIGNGAFSGCSSLRQFTIPSSIKLIENSLFNGCSSLKQMIIPLNIKSIGDNSFSKCSGLTQMNIPPSVTSIGNGAFSDCSSLNHIKILSTVTSFGLEIFKGIKKIEITGDIKKIPYKLFSKCSTLTQIKFPSTVTEICDYAFEGCSSLIDIKIPKSVTKIGDYAFFGCSSLSRIVLPPSVTYQGQYAFSNCGDNFRVERSQGCNIQ